LAFSFNSADIDFILKRKSLYTKWITNEVLRDSSRVGQICYIFCSDEYLLQINREYLNHDYYTDIVTFNYNEGKKVGGDIFISVDRIIENADTFKTDFTEELKRVMIHGILHLLGYNDTSPELKRKMHILENDALSRFPNS